MNTYVLLRTYLLQYITVIPVCQTTRYSYKLYWLIYGLAPIVSHRHDLTNTTQHKTVYHNKTWCITAWHDTTRHDTTQHNTTYHNIPQYNISHHDTTQHNNHNIPQYNISYHDTTQSNICNTTKLNNNDKWTTYKTLIWQSVTPNSPQHYLNANKCFVICLNCFVIVDEQEYKTPTSNAREREFSAIEGLPQSVRQEENVFFVLFLFTLTVNPITGYHSEQWINSILVNIHVCKVTNWIFSIIW